MEFPEWVQQIGGINMVTKQVDGLEDRLTSTEQKLYAANSDLICRVQELQKELIALKKVVAGMTQSKADYCAA